MTNPARRTAAVAGALSVLLLSSACGSNGPVTSSVPLKKLGSEVVTNGSLLANTAATEFHTQVSVIRPGHHDLACRGGKQRRYAAKISAAVPSNDSKDLDTVLSTLARSTLSSKGYRLTSKTSSSTGMLQTKPKDAGSQLTVQTVATRSGDRFTWVMRSYTRCIKS